ncbi:MAG: SDR family NAD(P)-dependent oxidoreductase [Proteobacteria bacterium]|nr:SDR family NAD(P)-dependent oxidoreductase [Pseudomonadota bacterium]MDA1355410.1 SDR family NAD(P)-dependent oxidoreductase [Pseudomonadota bacterium]
MTVNQKTMLLTGASRGIGHATVKLFHEHGWRVLTISRNPFDLNCPWPGGAENHVRADLADPESYPQLIAELSSRIGDHGLDALVNNAGISPKKPDGGRLGVLDCDHQMWIDVLNVNLVSIAMLARGLFPKLKISGGTIVNVTSIVGSRVHPFAGVAYACSKAGLAALTRELAKDFGEFGVRVNAIAPGEIKTSILSAGTEELVERRIPMGRLGDPMEVAETIKFLCSPESAYINGAEIHINGGQHV